MSKYKIAWLPGDGVGIEVMEAARIVLDRIGFDAEYIHGDIGWEFWRTEGDAFPARTVELLKKVDAAMFGAITSKPLKAAEAELVDSLQGQGAAVPLADRADAPDVRPLQLPAPVQGVPGQPAQLQGRPRPRRVPREHRGPLRRRRVQPGARGAGGHARQAVEGVRAVRRAAGDEYAVSCKINTKKGSERIARAAFEFARKFGRKKVTIVHKANVVRATDNLFLEQAREVAKGFPEIQLDEANIDALTMWLLKNPFNYDVLVAPNLYGDIISDLCAQMVGGLGFGCSGNIGTKLAVFEPTHGSAPKYAGHVQGEPDRDDPRRQDDARLAGRDREGREASSRPSPR